MEGVDYEAWQAYPSSSDAVPAQFPPTLFLTGTRAFELSAVAVAHAKLLKLGVDAALYLMESGWHGAHAYSHEVNAPMSDTPNRLTGHCTDCTLSRTGGCYGKTFT